MLLEQSTGGSGPGWTLTAIMPQNRLLFYAGDGANSGVNDPMTFAAGVWYHVMVERAAGLTTEYVNGVANPVGVSVGTVIPSSNPLLVGRRDDGDGNTYGGVNGLIDDVAIRDHALTADERACLDDNSAMPEPATVVLLTAGGVLRLFRRQRG